MVSCSKCSKSFSQERQKLGYTICLSCSTEERKVGHVVYPHKTGAYVQPVSSDTAKRLNQLDRRGYKRQSGYRMPKQSHLSQLTLQLYHLNNIYLNQIIFPQHKFMKKSLIIFRSGDIHEQWITSDN